MTGPSYRPSTERVPCGVAVVMRHRDDRLVMIHRTGAHGEGKLSFPGGWIDPGETPEQAAVREAWEEVGVTIDLSALSFLGYTADSHPEGLHGITLWFECRAWGGRARNTNPDRITTVELVERERLLVMNRDKLFLPVVNGIEKGLLDV